VLIDRTLTLALMRSVSRHVSEFMYRSSCIGVHVSEFTYRSSCIGVHVSEFMYRSSCIGVHVSELRHAEAIRLDGGSRSQGRQSQPFLSDESTYRIYRDTYTNIHTHKPSAMSSHCRSRLTSIVGRLLESQPDAYACEARNWNPSP
jgi:hypothetical protein